MEGRKLQRRFVPVKVRRARVSVQLDKCACSGCGRQDISVTKA
jgi:hypothetical protein